MYNVNVARTYISSGLHRRRPAREPHQNRLKLICNLRHVWPARVTSTRTDRRGGSEFHPVIARVYPPRNQREAWKIEIRIRRVRRFAPITTAAMESGYQPEFINSGYSHDYVQGLPACPSPRPSKQSMPYLRRF